MARVSVDLRVGLRIGVATVRDRFRNQTRSRREKAMYALLALFVVPWIAIVIKQAYSTGVATRGGVDIPVVAVARNVLVPAMLGLSVIAALESVQQLGSESVRSLLLTSVSTRAIIIGKVCSLFVSWVILVTVGLSVVISYSAGARTPLFPVAVMLALLPLFVLVLLVGLLLGYLLWLAIERLGLPEGMRQLLTAVLYVVIIMGMFAGGSFVGGSTAEGGLTGLIPTGDPMIPLGWYADLFFLGSPLATTIGPNTVLAAGLVLAAIPLCFGAVVRLAPRYWYASPVESEPDPGQSSAVDADLLPSETIGRLPGTVTGRSPTLRVAAGYLRSVKRRPSQLVFLAYYLFPVAPVLVQQLIGNPSAAPLTLGASLVLLGVWLAGGVFCLNPLGSEGTMLSQLVLAERPAKTFVHARLLLGSVLGVFLSVVGIALFAAVNEQVPLYAAGPAVVFVGMAVLASAGFGLGIGSVLPKFESVEIFESVETVAPSLIAAVVHAVLTALLLVGAIAVTGFAVLPESDLSIAQRFGLVATFAVLTGLIGDVGRRYAIARFRDHGREAVRTDRPFAVYTAVLLAVAAFVLGQLIALAAVFLIGVDLSIEVLLPVLFVVEYLGYAIVGGGFLYVTHRGLAYLDLSWPSLRDLGIVAGGVAVSLGLWLALSVVISELGLPAAEHALFDPKEDGSPRLLLTLVPLLLLVNGPVEEFLYRNVIQKYLAERFSRVVAVATASAIFALAHVPAYLSAGATGLGVTLSMLFVISSLWGWLYARTESLFVVAAIHGIYNAALVFGLYLSL